MNEQKCFQCDCSQCSSHSSRLTQTGILSVKVLLNNIVRFLSSVTDAIYKSGKKKVFICPNLTM